MRIGLTYDLRADYLKLGFHEEDVAEFDGPDTVESIEKALQVLGFETERIGNIKKLVNKIMVGYGWDLVFNIAEGVHGFGREAQVPALLEAYRIPYTFSDPLTLSLTLHKGMAKHILRDEGLPTPDFLVVENISDLERVILPCPLFAKPVAEGTGKGIDAASKIESRKDLYAVCFRLLEKYKQPVLVEKYLPGREFTVGVVGTGLEARIIGVMEVVLLDNAEQGAYTYTNKEYCEERVIYRLADDAPALQSAEVALAAYRILGCRDAGRVDLRLDETGTPNFLEVNPLAGLHPKHSDLPIMCTLSGIDYLTLIEWIVASAQKRAALTQPIKPSIYARESRIISDLDLERLR